MRGYGYLILFLLLFVTITSFYGADMSLLQKMVTEKNRYDAALETAALDASCVLVSLDRGNCLKLEKEEAIRIFFQSLSTGFGLSHDALAKEELPYYVPVILFMEQEGCSFWFREKNQAAAVGYQQQYSETYPYVCTVTADTSQRMYEIGFTTNDMLYIVDADTNEVWFGTQSDARERYPGLAFLQDLEMFENLRRETIMETIQNKMTAYINKSNQIGTQFGLSYEFQMPVLDEHFFARTLDQIGMIVFFQGYPYGNARTLRYNQYAIAGAQIEKIPYYYITNENGEHCYHKRNCALLTNNGHSLTDYVPYDTKQECASLGAYPCSECRP